MIDGQAGTALLGIARQALMRFLLYGEPDITGSTVFPDALMKRTSTFVTLYHVAGSQAPDRLRGCIGSTHGRLPLAHDVARNTVAAARDARFAPVQACELPRLRIHLSVLHPAQRLAYQTFEQLLAHLRPGVDGVIVACGERTALLLPQVWERLPQPEQFLQTLCHKAEIPWSLLCAAPPQVAVHTFKVAAFSE